MRSFVVIATMICTGCPVQAKPQVWKFDMGKWKFSTAYKIGGETKQRVCRRTKAQFVTNLSYFNLDQQQPMQVIDLFYRGGYFFNDYRYDWRRPVLVITANGLRIDRPVFRWKKRSGDRAAVAIDDFEQPRRRMWRQ